MAGEYAVSLISVGGVSGEFTTGLSEGGSRAKMLVYNASDSGSGELYVGQSGMGASTKFPIPKGVVVELPLTDNLEIYFEADAGEDGLLYILETT